MWCLWRLILTDSEPIPTNSPSDDRREGTDPDTLSDFIYHGNIISLASYLPIQGDPDLRKQRWKTFKCQ